MNRIEARALLESVYIEGGRLAAEAPERLLPYMTRLAAASTRRQAARVYADMMAEPNTGGWIGEAFFAIVNRCIVERWSASGLESIKAEAWRLVGRTARV